MENSNAIIAIILRNIMVRSSGDASPWEKLRSFCFRFSSYALSFHQVVFPYFVLHDHVHTESVARLARGLAEFVSANTPAHRTLLECAAYLHDCGMALPPRFINGLKLAEGAVERDSPQTIKKLREKLGGAYSRYFGSGVLTLTPKTSLSYLDVYVLRKLHPWTSALYIEKHLPSLLEDADLDPLRPPEVARPLALLAKWHNSAVEPSDYTCNVGGYTVNLKPLAEVLRLADAADFSRRRGRFVYQHIAEDCKEEYPSRLKHWIFKMGVEDVRLSYEERALVVELEGGGAWEVARAKLVGTLFFEVASNFLHDYEHFVRSSGTRLGIVAAYEGRSIDLTGWVSEIMKVEGQLKALKLKSLAKKGGRLGSYASELLEAFKREIEREEPGLTVQAPPLSNFLDDFDVLDALAHALYENEVAVMSELLELIAKECPRAKLLLDSIQPRY
jgi:hypothetical protein